MNTISASRITTWLMCPRKYRLTYVDKAPWDFVPSALPLGTAIHAAIETWYREHITGSTIGSDDLKDIFTWFWTRETDGKKLDVDDPTTIREQGLALIEAFHRDVRPGKVVEIEMPFRVPLIDHETGEMLPVDLTGRIDLVEEDDHGNPVIVDFKTAARRPSELDLDRNIQLSGYAYAWRHLMLSDSVSAVEFSQAALASMTNGQHAVHPSDSHDLGSQADTPILCRIDALLKQKTPTMSQHFTVRTAGHDRFFVRMAMEVASAIQAEAFPPNLGWQCATCPFDKICRS